MAHNPLPDPAAAHPGEAAMLAAVLANLTDDLPKLVYADWLEERGDPRGPFLREFVHAARSGEKLPTPKRGRKPWLDLIGATAVTAARGCELPISPDELLRDGLPALRFTSEPAADIESAVGASKLSGEPDVPAGFEWPEYLGEPLSFLAQFNLAELSGSPAGWVLPKTGLLSVFYSTTGDVFGSPDVGGWRVFHFPDLDSVDRRNSPGVLDPDARFSSRLTFTETLVLPEYRRFDDAELGDAYRNEVSNTHLGHQLLGHPRWLQSEGWVFDAKAGSSAVRHLLTIDSDDRVGWMWGDAGLLYFGIAADDLKAGRFDRTVFEMQCC